MLIHFLIAGTLIPLSLEISERPAATLSPKVKGKRFNIVTCPDRV